MFKGMIVQGSDFFGPVRGPDFLIPVRGPDFWTLRSFKFKNIFFCHVLKGMISNLDWSLNNQFSFCQPLFSIVSIKQQTLKNFIFTQILFPIRNTILK